MNQISWVSLSESLGQGASRVKGVGTGAVGTGGAIRVADRDLGDTIVNAPIDKTAFLMVTSEPSGATLYINGQEKGSTPYQDELPWGRYKLTVDKGLYHPAQQEVLIDSAKTREVPFTLKPAFGAASIESQPPGAAVYLDGELMGRTPLRLEQKPSRIYELRVEAPDHKVYTGQLQIEDQQLATLSVELDSSVGGIAIDSQPSGAQIQLNGEVVGTTPYRASRKPPGEYTVRLSMPKYLSQELHFRVSAGFEYKRTVVLPANFGSQG